jgi:tRNA pseudouridine38-40 synthase
MRYFIELSYNGEAYHGWQVQQNAVSVQEVLNDALSKKLREEIACTGSGRTDTGVHALMQVAHFDAKQQISSYSDLRHQLNSLLPHDIAVNNIYQVKEDASARFDAVSRSYVYYIHQQKQPFLHGHSYLFTRDVELAVMNEVCDLLIDWSDFQSFSKVHTDVHTFDCDITQAHWERQNDKVVFSVTANRFLRGMIRALVGTMLDVGTGKLSVADFKAILESRDRKKAGRAVPACGLYLCDIRYPENIKL